MIRAIDSKTRRKANEPQQVLLDALGGAIGAFGKKVIAGQASDPELEAGEVEDAEFVEVEEGAGH